MILIKEQRCLLLKSEFVKSILKSRNIPKLYIKLNDTCKLKLEFKKTIFVNELWVIKWVTGWKNVDCHSNRNLFFKTYSK